MSDRRDTEFSFGQTISIFTVNKEGRTTNLRVTQKEDEVDFFHGVEWTTTKSGPKYNRSDSPKMFCERLWGRGLRLN